MTVENDVPTLNLSGGNAPAAVTAMVYEDALGHENDTLDRSTGNLEGLGQVAQVSGFGSSGTGHPLSLSTLISSGADEPVTFSLVTSAGALTSALGTLYSNGDTLSYTVSGDTLSATAGSGSGSRTVFTLTVSSDGQWNFNLNDQLDHLDNSGDSGTALKNGTTSGMGALNFSTLVMVTDKDHDPVIIGNLTSGSNLFTVTVENDIPIARLDLPESVFEGSAKIGSTGTGALLGKANLLGNDRPGADSPIRISEISYVKPDGSTDVVAISDGGQTASLQTRYGWVQVWSNGNWEYTPDPVLAHVGSDLFNDVLTYKIIDKDGDTSTNTKSISVNDTIPIISNPTQSIVYESSPFHTVFTGSLPVIRVADPFKVVFNDPASGGELYTADGQLITYSSTESVLTAHVYGDPTNIAFTITIKNATSTNAYFEFDLYQKLDHTLFTDTQFLDLSIAYKVQETDFVGSDIVTSFPNYPVSTADAAVFHVIVVDDTIVNSPTTGDDILLFDGTFSAPPFNGTPPVDMLGGTDTLLFPKTLTTLDFSTLNGKITNLEIIDLSVDGANSITNILGADVNAVTSSNSLYILGTSEDHVALNGFTQSNSDPLIYNLNGSNHLLNEYTNAVSGSTVFVEKDISMP